METDTNYTLGLDLGTNSIGWAILSESDGDIKTIVDAGARVFEAGMNIDEKGRAESHNVQRRNARQARRQTDRRARRRRELFKILCGAGLLPAGDLAELSPPLADCMSSDPYLLRARALDEKLDPFEIGRALYHLAQRRGFLSNRKTAPKKNEEEGKVKAAIKKFEAEMQAAGARTWGEFLSKINPHEQRLRGRYTHRSWFEHEFEEIWNGQAKNYPDLLTADLKTKIQHAIFYQRPLKSQKFLIGTCELEPGKRRASMARLEAQRARYLQDINNLKYRDDSGNWHSLSDVQRDTLIQHLEKNKKLTLAALRGKKLLNLPKGTPFNLEAGERKDIKGNTTASELRAIFGDPWDTMTDDERTKIVDIVMCVRSVDTLKRIGRKGWGLSEEAADALSNIHLEDDYSRHSIAALKKLLPFLEQGLPYATAVEKAYPGRNANVPIVDELPPVKKWGEIRNPIVERTLTELRHLVNALIRRYGKPARIRIELARDLKQSAKGRELTTRRMRENEAKHAHAAETIAKEFDNNYRPSREDRIKILLWLECNRQCPYTGHIINIHDLLGKDSRYDIEHIIPFSRSLDNSFTNLTLCEASENRNRKKNYTPLEAYGGDPERYAEILERVKAFNNPEKLARFKMEAEEGMDLTDDFCSRQLNDTRYASVLARDYLNQLYGGEWRTHIQVSAGGVTGYLRWVWRLNPILGDGPRKTRDDHRHHAIDAIVIGLVSPKWVHALAEASKRSYRYERFPNFADPWPGFVTDARNAIDAIVVSHRFSNRVRGQMHDESLYGEIQIRRKGAPADEKEIRYVIRKPIARLSEPEIRKEMIVDKAVRQAVADAFQETGGDHKQFIKLMQEPANHPVLKFKSGTTLPIHRVRVFQKVNPEPLGNGASQRLVETSNNHHVEIFEGKDKRGKIVWIERVVTLIEAMRRKRAGEPIYSSVDENGNPLVLCLARNQILELDCDGKRILRKIQKLSSQYYNLRRIEDARKADDVDYRKNSGDGILIQSLPKFRELRPRLISISVDGKISESDERQNYRHQRDGCADPDRSGPAAD